MINILKNKAKYLKVFILAGLLTLIFGCGEEPKDLYGPSLLYGVPNCQTAQDCIDKYGEGWYCDIPEESPDGYCSIKNSQ